MKWTFPTLESPDKFVTRQDYLEYLRKQIRLLAEMCEAELKEFQIKRKRKNK